MLTENRLFDAVSKKVKNCEIDGRARLYQFPMCRGSGYLYLHFCHFRMHCNLAVRPVTYFFTSVSQKVNLSFVSGGFSKLNPSAAH
jgi:hypothetical protein